jgi:hypothetical protein
LEWLTDLVPLLAFELSTVEWGEHLEKKKKKKTLLMQQKHLAQCFQRESLLAQEYRVPTQRLLAGSL